MKNKFFLFFISLSIIVAYSCKKKEDLAKSNPNNVYLETHQDTAAINSDENFVDAQTAVNMAERNDFSAMREEKAMYKWASTAAVRLNKVDTVITIRDSNDVADYYIIKFKNKGFKILSADKRYPTLLAFSDENTFDEKRVTTGLNDWLIDQKKSIEIIRYDTVKSNNYVNNIIKPSSFSNQSASSTTMNSQSKNGTVNSDSIGPIIKTTWDQGTGYNTYCPDLSCSTAGNGKAWTGCVATAVAQVMYYYSYPTTYNFSAMSLNFGSDETARLMHDIGKSIGMDYTHCDGSGVDGAKTISAFTNFGYTGGKTADGVDFNIIFNELKNNRPVIISGGRKTKTFIFFNRYTDGHEWVCDGCYTSTSTTTICIRNPRGGCNDHTATATTHMYHMNWGWSGSNNGFYQEGYFSPNDLPYTDPTGDSDTNPGTYNYDNETYYGMTVPQ